jgi:hypothetical protein
VAKDRALQEAIRRHLRRALEAADTTDIGHRRRKRKLEELAERRRKLLELHYADRVSAELFAEEEAKITREIEALRQEQEHRITEKGRLSEVAERFEEVARILREMDLGGDLGTVFGSGAARARGGAPRGRRHLPRPSRSQRGGVPRLNVTLQEVGLKGAEGQFVGVGGGI